MTDMTDTIIPKSDQLNSDDLLAGPITVTITRVSRASTSEQPIAVYFEGDKGKPYLPCKSMRRVMVAVWDKDATKYTGRSMTLFRDPTVTWGGMEVGGIRISHMSHMEGPMTMALTATKKARKPYRVLPLNVALKSAPDAIPSPVAEQPREPTPQEKAEAWADDMVAKLEAARTYEQVNAIVGHPGLAKGMERLEAIGATDAYNRLDAARSAAMDRAIADSAMPVIPTTENAE